MRMSNTLRAGRAGGMALVGLVGCLPNNGGTGNDSGGEVPFCEALSYAGQTRIEEGGGSGGSGKVVGRVVTSKSSDIHDPNYVASVPYTLENLDVGGTNTLGETDTEGAFVEILGAGNWEIKLAAQKVGYQCENTMDFLVQAGNTTYLCIALNCQ